MQLVTVGPVADQACLFIQLCHIFVQRHQPYRRILYVLPKTWHAARFLVGLLPAACVQLGEESLPMLTYASAGPDKYTYWLVVVSRVARIGCVKKPFVVVTRVACIIMIVSKSLCCSTLGCPHYQGCVKIL